MGGSFYHTSHATKDSASFLLVRALPATFLSFTQAHNIARPISSLFFHVQARANSRNTSPVLREHVFSESAF